ncbi:hypothetical protein C8R47DRAFT_216720 [Mycena vitilis]|nr:hypothetical protein C8R47DRAFT_216720 [Mycena vitilis]
MFPPVFLLALTTFRRTAADATTDVTTTFTETPTVVVPVRPCPTSGPLACSGFLTATERRVTDTLTETLPCPTSGPQACSGFLTETLYTIYTTTAFRSALAPKIASLDTQTALAFKVIFRIDGVYFHHYQRCYFHCGPRIRALIGVFNITLARGVFEQCREKFKCHRRCVDLKK